MIAMKMKHKTKPYNTDQSYHVSMYYSFENIQDIQDNQTPLVLMMSASSASNNYIADLVGVPMI
jgi:hypothetical protein